MEKAASQTNFSPRELQPQFSLTTNLDSNLIRSAAAGDWRDSKIRLTGGYPEISFTSFGGLSDRHPAANLTRTYSISENPLRGSREHKLAFRRRLPSILQSFRSQEVRKGVLCYRPSRTSQYANREHAARNRHGRTICGLPCWVSSANSLQPAQTCLTNSAPIEFDFFAQGRWRSVRICHSNLGMRYEYDWTYTEAENQIANHGVAPGFTLPLLVLPGHAGHRRNIYGAMYGGPQPISAPRIGIAWKPQKKTGVRTG